MSSSNDPGLCYKYKYQYDAAIANQVQSDALAVLREQLMQQQGHDATVPLAALFPGLEYGGNKPFVRPGTNCPSLSWKIVPKQRILPYTVQKQNGGPQKRVRLYGDNARQNPEDDLPVTCIMPEDLKAFLNALPEDAHVILRLGFARPWPEEKPLCWLQLNGVIAVV